MRIFHMLAGRNSEHNIVFIKAWNEWGEGNYLESDMNTVGNIWMQQKRHWVTISDNNYGSFTREQLSLMPLQRPVVSKGEVVIGKNVWIGDKATILSGVHIGEGSVIGANSVVTKDIPPYSLVVGDPARVVKSL